MKLNKTIKSLPLLVADTQKEQGKLINNAIKQWNQKARTVQADLHRLACSTLNHYFMYGDTTLMSRLIEAMPKSQRAQKLNFWMCEHGGIEYDVNVFKKREQYSAIERELKLQQAIANPFWTMKQHINEDETFNYASWEAKAVAAIAKLIEHSDNVFDINGLVNKAKVKAGKRDAVRFDGTKVQFYIDHGMVQTPIFVNQAM